MKGCMPQKSFGDPTHVFDEVIGKGSEIVDYDRVNLK
jgi:hypothetical protein